MAGKRPTSEELLLMAERVRRLCVHYLDNPQNEYIANKLEPTLRHFIANQPVKTLAEELAHVAWRVLRDGGERGMIQKALRRVESLYAEHGATWKADRAELRSALRAEVAAYEANARGVGRPVKPETRAARVLRLLQGKKAKADNGRRGVRADESRLLGEALANVNAMRNL